ncbi:MAG: response regulator [Proteobacteria bacterium]|nr:response regulator [Pseudomonadota bacterium]MBU1583720.1 response regulator [Pseudomonadota bacterium]MBU2453619.1 response regulator [Pseudomonadota bacterium]
MKCAKKNGSNSIVSFHEKIGKKPNGEFKQTHCVFSDITEQKKAETSAKRLEAQLQQARKLEAIGVLAGGIAHDFNNILFPIMGFSELTLEELPENSPVRENVNAILTGAKRAAELVQQILAFSAPRQKSPEPIIVQSVFKEAISFLRAIIPQNIDIRQEISPTPICIMNDPTQLYEIVMNLCTNAYHAMEEEGGLLSIRVNEVEVGAGRINKGMEMTPGRYCRIDIHDTGSGIPAEHLDKIFDPYFSTKEIGKGSGIGLSVVHGIVKEHNGCIQVKSRPGKTEFTVYFPITDRIKKKDQIRQLFVKSIGNEKILFVDDETAIVEIVTQSLERLGYEVTGKTSSVEALNEFETHPDRFDLIITDMTMPGIIGTNLIKKIREIRPGIPVMLCTGYSHLADAETAKALNINEFIYKPVSINELSAKVRKIFDQTNEPQAINEPDNM